MKTFISTKAVILIVMLSFTALLISSCSKDPDPEPIVYGDAKVSVTNTVSGSNAQEFYQNDTKISTSAVAYGETSPYLTIKAGNSILAFRNVGGTTANASLSVGLETDWSVSLFYIVDPTGNPNVVGYVDNNVAPEAGKIKVRFVNLAPALVNTLNISLADNTAIHNGLSFANQSPYKTLEANASLQVEVTNSGIKVPLTGTTFVAGKIYTIWFDAATTTTAKFHVIQQN